MPGDGRSADTNGQVRALLDEGLRSGRFAPGSKLPTERALAADLRTSRVGVRQALGALEREGLITRHVGRGTFIARPAAEDTTDTQQTSPPR
jgi:DNA-binding GntR family transcriptional regulator